MCIDKFSRCCAPDAKSVNEFVPTIKTRLTNAYVELSKAHEQAMMVGDWQLTQQINNKMNNVAQLMVGMD